MWEPQGGEHRQWRDLKPGDLVANGRKVWVVREARLVRVIDWDEADRGRYEAERDRAARAARAGRPFPPDGRLNPGSEEEWDGRPLYLIVVPASGGKRRHVKVRPYAGRRVFVLHPHYPVCRECGEPWPCPELDIKRELDKGAAEMARLEGIMPGCCWACGEPVTSRHKSVSFGGENLLLPGAPPPAFHLRRRSKGGRSCPSAAMAYEERWVPAAEGRRWRLSCPGHVVRHVDGTECQAEPECPGPGAYHRNGISHQFYRTGNGAVLPVIGMGAEKCRRCLDAVEGGIFDRESPARVNLPRR
jgi:hypothetical protein